MIERQTDRWMDGWIDIDRQTDRWTDRYTHTKHTHTILSH